MIERGDLTLPLPDVCDKQLVIRPEIGRAAGERVAAAGLVAGGGGRRRGPRLEVLRQRVALGVDELLAQQAGTRHLAVEADQRAVRLLAERHLADPEYHERVEDAADHREDQQAAEPGEQLAHNGRETRHDDQPPNPGMNWMMRSMSLIPMNGMMRPPTP